MLSKRLESLVKYVDKSDNLIDIGCDHALLDIHLIKNKIIDKIIVSDVHKNALDSGIENIKKNKLSNKIEARLGNGLDVLSSNDNIDTVLISGMGTSTILKIFDNKYQKNINKLILQSNNDHYELRKNIIKLGYYIEAEEYLVDNKKNYINIVFKKGIKKYTNKELKYGPILINDTKYLEFELSNCERIKKLIPKMKLRYQIKLNKEIKLLNKYIKRSKNNG